MCNKLNLSFGIFQLLASSTNQNTQLIQLQQEKTNLALKLDNQHIATQR